MAGILHLISHLEEGGAQRLLSEVLARSTRRPAEVAALIASPPDKLFPFFRKEYAPIHYLSQSGDFYYPGIVPKLRALLKERKYDMIQCWLFESIVQGVIAGRKEKVPCIAFPHNMRELLYTNHKLWERILIRKMLLSADLTLFPSYSTAIDFLNAGWVDFTRVRVAQNGVDCNHFQPVVSSGNALIAVGRMSPEKGFSTLDRVAERLRKHFPHLRCIVAGGGRDTLFPNLEQIGSVDDVRKVFQQGSVYISTSLVEGLSVALLESQAMGIPAVVRRIGANSEVIEHGVNGFLAGSEEEYVDACKRLLEEEDLRVAMGKAARTTVMERFSIDRQVARMESVHHELL